MTSGIGMVSVEKSTPWRGGVEVGDGDDLGRIFGEGNRKWQHTAASGAEPRVDALRCSGLDTFG